MKTIEVRTVRWPTCGWSREASVTATDCAEVTRAPVANFLSGSPTVAIGKANKDQKDQADAAGCILRDH